MLTATQAILILLWVTLFGAFGRFTGIGLPAGGVVLNAVVTGLIMGDLKTGFYLGGTYELMNIGLNPLGGSTVPNYTLGAIVGVAFGAKAGVDTGMAVGIVVATLASSLDVFGKMSGSIFLHKAQKEIRSKKLDSAMKWIWWGAWPGLLLGGTIPLIILFAFGEPVVAAINTTIPHWVLKGFQNAGNMLPAIGFAILLRSMNLKGNFQYLLIGFVIYAYFGVSALGAALIGIALAMIAYYNNEKLIDLKNNAGGNVGDE